MEKNQNHEKNLEFKPAQLRNNASSCYVEYYVEHPITGKLVRKRKKINHIVKNQRKAYGERIVRNLNTKMYKGVNPLISGENTKHYTLLVDAINSFMISKRKELRENSIRSYESFTQKLIKYTLDFLEEDLFTIHFSKNNAIAMLEYFYTHHNLGNNTYNNHLSFFRLLWNWLKEMNYCIDNVFEGIKPKKKVPKSRVLVDMPTKKRIKEYFKKHDKPMYIASLLVYHSLIRPNEITYLTPGHFNLKNQTIMIPEQASKNGNMRISTIPNSMMLELVESKILEVPKDYYIIGRNFLPGKVRLDPREFTRNWNTMRIALKLPVNIKFYSLRDTGIVQMLDDGIAPQEVMKQADHSSLEMTSLYAKHANPEGSIQIKTKKSSF